MKGLLTKEWCVLKKNCVSIFILILLFAAVGIYTNSTFMLTYVAIILGMIPVNYMTLDETSKWEQYSLAMPYKRSSIVSAKYVIVLILALISTVIMAIGLLFSFHKHGQFELKWYLLDLSMSPVLGILPPSISLPLNYKFGTGKGRLVLAIIASAIVGTIGVLAANNPDIPALLSIHLAGYDEFEIIPIVLVAITVIYAFSWLISTMIFNSKDL